MPYRNLGGTGLMVSALSFGTMTLQDLADEVPGKISRGEEAFELLQACYKGGVNFFDCAEVYGGGGSSERVLGQCIQTGIERGLWGRQDLVISTKIHGGGRGNLDTINSIGLSRKHLYEGLKASLGQLQLEYVDLVLCHRPDPRTPLEEVVRGMNHLIDRGMTFCESACMRMRMPSASAPARAHSPLPALSLPPLVLFSVLPAGLLV